MRRTKTRTDSPSPEGAESTAPVTAENTAAPVAVEPTAESTPTRKPRASRARKTAPVDDTPPTTVDAAPAVIAPTAIDAVESVAPLRTRAPRKPRRAAAATEPAPESAPEPASLNGKSAHLEPVAAPADPEPAAATTEADVQVDRPRRPRRGRRHSEQVGDAAPSHSPDPSPVAESVAAPDATVDQSAAEAPSDAPTHPIRERGHRRRNRDRRNRDRDRDRTQQPGMEGQPVNGNRPPRIAAPASEPVDGIIELTNQGHGFLRRDANWVPSRDDLFVPNGLIRQFGLRSGHSVRASWRPPGKGQRSASVSQVLMIEGVPASSARQAPQFDSLTAESPRRRIRLERGPEDTSGRAIDLFAPMGFGTRGLVIAQPFAGKTTLLKNIATSIAEHYPETERFILLIDERPEEVTDFRRANVGQVIGSSYDLGTENHLKNAELLLQRCMRLVEAGKDVVMLVDSLTRLLRASNLSGKNSGRTMSGGLDPAALQFPRKLFGSARATESAGSLTIIATVLVDTGSRLDDLVFEEFKGTGNWELRLDRKLAEARLFPAIDIPASGTRREELLYTEAEAIAVPRLRRFLHGNSGDRVEQLDMLLKWLRKFPTNQQIIELASQLQTGGRR